MKKVVSFKTVPSEYPGHQNVYILYDDGTLWFLSATGCCGSAAFRDPLCISDGKTMEDEKYPLLGSYKDRINATR